MASNIENGVYRTLVQERHARGRRMQIFYFASLVVAMLTLLMLMYNIVNQSFGVVVQTFEVRPEELSETPYEELSGEELGAILLAEVPRRMLVLVRDELRAVPEDQFTRVPLSEAIDGDLPEGWVDLAIIDLSQEEQSQLLVLNLSADELRGLVDQEILQPTIQQSWTLTESLTDRSAINDLVEERYPEGEILWRSWVNLDFINSALTFTPGTTGIFPALLGSIWIMIIVGLVSFPLGVGAAIYLQEYATDTWYNRLIETNIRNLAGVPSIIYGMLGLAIFVRTLVAITSGTAFGTENDSGRTILSAGLTLALLILPIIIIASQEALRAVPWAIREASYGLGATRWQTISRQVLPTAMPGILTGTILALSRAIGETAPLIVVGAAAFISVNPDGPFARFTALPILVYNWTAQPDPQFRNAAAAAILVLLVLLLTMNSVAIVLRNRYSGRL